MPSDYIKPTVTSSLDDRVRTIEQQIKNRENLTQILRKNGLYQDLMAEGQVDEAIREVDRNLVIDVRGGNVFWIHFNGSSPEQAGGCCQLRRRYLHRREPPASRGSGREHHGLPHRGAGGNEAAARRAGVAGRRLSPAE